MKMLSHLWENIQGYLFPSLEEEVGELNEKQKHFVRVVELLDLDRFMIPYEWQGKGRKPESRFHLVKSFIAKSIYNFCETNAFIDYLESCPTLRRLCGYETIGEIPSESTFSRAFSEFATGTLPSQIFEAMVKAHLGEKIHGHVSRDSSAIEVREKPQKVERLEIVEPKGQKKKGRPRKGEEPLEKEPTKLQIQLERSLEENLKDLPQRCNRGTKVDSKGYKISWIGYKIHVDCVDGDIPVSVILTSASVHDSQVAIPLAQMTQERIINLYDLMDSAYDAPQIREYSSRINHVPIIDFNKRRGEKKEFEPAHKQRYKERSSIERVFSNLKDNFGIARIRVRGAYKVMAHLMFSMIALTGTQIFNFCQ
jgi:hypothetical protein